MMIDSLSLHPSHSLDVIANFMNDTLNDFKVTDRQTFIKFLELLRKDFLNNPEIWKNKSLPDFLEALSAYTEDVQGYYDNMKLNVNADKPEWSTFADIFKGAKMYE
jgi:hypothetical protein